MHQNLKKIIYLLIISSCFISTNSATASSFFDDFQDRNINFIRKFSRTDPQYRYLDGNSAKSVYLSPTTETGYDGTHWKVIKLSENRYAFRCGFLVNPSYYLDANSDGRVYLNTTTDISCAAGTHWQPIKLDENTYAFRCGYVVNPSYYLAVNPDGRVFLSNTIDYPETQWNISISYRN